MKLEHGTNLDVISAQQQEISLLSETTQELFAEYGQLADRHQDLERLVAEIKGYNATLTQVVHKHETTLCQQDATINQLRGGFQSPRIVVRQLVKLMLHRLRLRPLPEPPA